MPDSLIPAVARSLDRLFDPSAVDALSPAMALRQWRADLWDTTWAPAWVVTAVVLLLAPLLLVACTRVVTEAVER